MVKFRLSVASKFGAMSGCDASIPVSMIPTSTSGLPVSTAYDPSTVASIISMSHCRPATGSASTAVASSAASSTTSDSNAAVTPSASIKALDVVDLLTEVQLGVSDDAVGSRAS